MRFKITRIEAGISIREAKNSWFRAKVQDAEGENFGGGEECVEVHKRYAVWNKR